MRHAEQFECGTVVKTPSILVLEIIHPRWMHGYNKLLSIALQSEEQVTEAFGLFYSIGIDFFGQPELNRPTVKALSELGIRCSKYWPLGSKLGYGGRVRLLHLNLPFPCRFGGTASSL